MATFPTCTARSTGLPSGGGGDATIAIGPASTGVGSENTGTIPYSIPVGRGTYDLVAVSTAIPVSGFPRALVRRALPVQSNVAADIDVGQGASLVDSGDALTVTGADAVESVSTGVTFSTATTMPIWSSFIGLFGPGVELGNLSRATYLVLPPDLFLPGDLYCGFAVADSVSPVNQPVHNESRGMQRFFATPGNFVLDLPAPFSPTVALQKPAGNGTSPAVVQTGLPSYPGAVLYTIRCMNWQAEITTGGLGSDTSYTLPDWNLIHGDDGGVIAGFAGQGFSTAPVLCTMVAHSGDDPTLPPKDGTVFRTATLELSAQ